MPITADAALELAKTKWQDPAFRNQKVNEWTHFALAKYQTRVKPPMIRAEWFTLLAFSLMALGLLVYSLKRKH
jgi:hypothetical protein